MTTHGVLGRVQAPQHGQGVAVGGCVPPRQLVLGSIRRRAAPQNGERHQEQRPRRFEWRPGQAFRRSDLESGRWVEPPADPSFGD